MGRHSNSLLALLLASAAGGCAEDGGRPLVALDAGAGAEATLCAPGRWACPSVLESARCDEAGAGWAERVPCVDGQRCAAGSGQCREPLCTPGNTSCAGDRTVTRCDDDGQSWLVPQACAEGTFCIQAQCAYGGCLGHVLLLIDKSGSMELHWGEVRRSVLKLVTEHPTARFGAMAFPAHFLCEAPAWPQVTLSTHNLEAKLEAFFDDYAPGGPTPLASALARVEAKAPTLFGGEAGTLVVLSDGADTCADPTTILDTLAALTARLRVEHDVTTWVIGYRYTGDAAQLDAIAANGGSPHARHVPAGGEAELDDALRGIVTDWKLCF